MKNILLILTLLPWLCYFGARIIDSLKGTKNKKIDIKWFKNNWNKIFHAEEILLIAIFVYFSIQGNVGINKIVNEMLFVVMNLYLFINTFYDKRKTDNGELDKKDILVSIITLLTLFIPLSYYIKTKDIVHTYYFLFGFVFFSYPIVIICRFIDKILRKIIKR